MDWDGCVNLAQSYLENSPLIVLGSGASMPYGLPSMRNLAEAIEADPVVKDDPEFANLCQAIILARTMTEACRKHIIEAKIRKHLIFERADDQHTTVYSNGWSETYDGQYYCNAFDQC